MGIRQQALRFSWRRLVILVAVIAVVAGVATRTFHDSCVVHPTAQDDSPNAKHQHLDNDAFALAEPLPQVSNLLPAATPHAPPREFSVVSVEVPEYLYNRPPPDSSLL